jgi:hypothetical protein
MTKQEKELIVNILELLRYMNNYPRSVEVELRINELIERIKP